MRTFFHLCLTALLSTVVLSAVEPDPLSFFPHHVGDTWVYQYYTNEMRTRTVINVNSVAPDTIYIDFGATAAIRFLDDKYNIFFPLSNFTLHEYKLDAQKDETWIVRPDSEHATRIDAIVQDV